jgi:hypothetical protein
MDGPSIGSLKTLARNNGNMHQGSTTIVENHFEILSPEVDLVENESLVIIGEGSLTLETPSF